LVETGNAIDAAERASGWMAISERALVREGRLPRTRWRRSTCQRSDVSEGAEHEECLPGLFA
jgi:hypothetical protein